MDLVTPHLKTVLKSYQHSATRSLQGPGSGSFFPSNSSLNTKKCLLVRYQNSGSSDDGTKLRENAVPDNNDDTDVIATTSTSSSTTSSALFTTAAITTTTTTASTVTSDAVSTLTATTSQSDASSSEQKSHITKVKRALGLQFQVPILAIADTSRSERTETLFEGETIACFEVGGEKRLCLPQVLNTVLNEFNVFQINKECDNLQIYCSRCTPDQLNELKNAGDLPSTAPSCGLIKKTDASRLVSALLYIFPVLPTKFAKDAYASSFKVYHKCFGNGYGLCRPNLFIDRTSRCIECLDCFGMFSFEHFVSHAHKYLENSTVHWGFDSANWRYYLKVANNQNNRDHKFNKILDLIYENFETASTSDRSPIPTKIHQELMLSCKRRLAGHYPEPQIKQEFIDGPLKKRKIEDVPLHKYAYPPSREPLYFQQMLNSSNSRTGFKPAISQGSKDFRNGYYSHLSMSANPGSCLNLSMRYNDAQQLHKPAKVVPVTEVHNFQNNYQPNASLVPLARNGTITTQSTHSAATVITSTKSSSLSITSLPRWKQFSKNYSENVLKNDDEHYSTESSSSSFVDISIAAKTKQNSTVAARTASKNPETATYTTNMKSTNSRSTIQSNAELRETANNLHKLLQNIGDSNLRSQCLNTLKLLTDSLITSDFNFNFNKSDDGHLKTIKSEPLSDDSNISNCNLPQGSPSSFSSSATHAFISNDLQDYTDINIKTEDGPS